jgi:hypothetical protein
VSAALAEVRLHIPEAPEFLRAEWLGAVLDGADLLAVVVKDGGVAEWLWGRWRVLERAGLEHDAFVAIVAAYRREIWLYLAGERTWEQCCAGLVGRIARRLPG